MKLLPIQTAEHLDLAAGWLQRKENYQWLDFGGGRHGVTPTLLRIMVQRDTHFIRLYTSDTDDMPIGIVALNNVDHHFKTGTFWCVAGDKSFRKRGYARIAAARLLRLAFRELGLRSISTWTVEHNVSRRTVERLGFRLVGRQRQCHLIDGTAYDRLLYDLLADEHRTTEWSGSRADAPPVMSAVLAALVFAGSAPLNACAARAGTPFQCSFESSWEGCGFTLQAKSSDRAASVETAGLPSVRLTTLPGDDGIAGSGRAERADLSLSPAATGCSQGQVQWWAHSLYFPKDYTLPVANRADPWPWAVVFDFHQTGSEGQANFQIEIAGNPPELQFAISGGSVVSMGGPGSGTRVWPIGPVVRDHWYNFVYHIRWSSGSDGWFDAWVDGKQLLAYHGPTLYAGQGCYLKLANYHTPVGKPVSVLHARLQRCPASDEVIVSRTSDATSPADVTTPSRASWPVRCTRSPAPADPRTSS